MEKTQLESSRSRVILRELAGSEEARHRKQRLVGTDSLKPEGGSADQVLAHQTL